MCWASTRSLPPRSASVLATRRMRSCARADSPSPLLVGPRWLVYCRDSAFPLQREEERTGKRRARSAMSERDTAFRLDKEDRKEIEKLRKKEKDARIYSRYLMLLWLDD